MVFEENIVERGEEEVVLKVTQQRCFSICKSSCTLSTHFEVWLIMHKDTKYWSDGVGTYLKIRRENSKELAVFVL